jgi:hypothetical protein
MLTGWLTMFFYNKKHILKLVCTSNIYIDKLKPQAISLMNISSGLFFHPSHQNEDVLTRRAS